MFVSDCLGLNEHGHLTIGGMDTVALAHTYGTPLYVMDEDQIRAFCRMYKDSIDRFYGGRGRVAYASKAFCCKEMYRIMKSEGLGVDVVSGGELYTAAAVDFPGDKIYFHGNNKTPQELAYAIEYGVGRIVVDNLTELELLNQLAVSQNKNVAIMLRIKPGIDAHTHDFVRTGQIDSKFGFALETGEALKAVSYVLEHKNVTLKGVHCHIGSQIFDIDPFELAAQVMLGFMAEVKNKTGLVMTELNLGGGFGIKYVDAHDPVPYNKYMEKVSIMIKNTCKELGLDTPFIIMEPGRSIVGPAGITLYTVGSVKEIPGVRTYVSIDGGMTDNPRYALYKSPYDALIANKAGLQRTKKVTIAGKCCESGDLIGEGMPIQEAAPGDILAVCATGAYNYSMASNYNRVSRAAAVMVSGGESRVIIRRESYDDLVRNDI